MSRLASVHKSLVLGSEMLPEFCCCVVNFLNVKCHARAFLSDGRTGLKCLLAFGLMAVKVKEGQQKLSPGHAIPSFAFDWPCDLLIVQPIENRPHKDQRTFTCLLALTVHPSIHPIIIHPSLHLIHLSIHPTVSSFMQCS